MTTQLAITFQGDEANLYAIIRRVVDGYVWNGLTFVEWADGDIGDYDVPLTSAGGDLYQADFPSAVTSGTRVRVQYYERAGGTPATSDLLLYTESLDWNGVTLSGGGGAVASDALTTLTGVKRQLGITTSASDALLADLINAASERIKRIAGRAFFAADYVQWIDARGQEAVTVKETPVQRVNAVAWLDRDAINVTYAGAAIYARVIVHDTGVRLSSMVADGTATNTDLTFSTYPTGSTMASAIAAVSGWSASLASDDLPSKHLAPRTYDAKRQSAHLRGAYDYDTPASVDAGAGIVTLNPGAYHHDEYGGGAVRLGGIGYGKHRVMIDYRGGYETVPADLDQLAREMVQRAYGAAGKDTSLQSESLGSYSYSLIDSQALSVTDEMTLDRYRKVVIA